MAKQPTTEATEAGKLQAENAELQKKVTALESEASKLTEDKKSLEDQLESVSTSIDSLEALLTKERENGENLEGEIAELNELITDLRAQLESETSRAEAKQNIVTHAGKKYQVKAQTFHYNGRERSAKDVTTGSDLLAELVDIGAGVLEEISDQE